MELFSALYEHLLVPFLLFSIASSMISVYSGRNSEYSSVAKRRLSWGGRDVHSPDQQVLDQYRPAHGGKSVSQLCENMDRLQKPLLYLHWKRQTRTRSLLNNLYSNTVGSRGKGVGLGLLCAREEEWFPGDVILTGKGQLSQYNRFQKKRAHRKTENAKLSCYL